MDPASAPPGQSIVLFAQAGYTSMLEIVRTGVMTNSGGVLKFPIPRAAGAT